MVDVNIMICMKKCVLYYIYIWWKENNIEEREVFVEINNKIEKIDDVEEFVFKCIIMCFIYDEDEILYVIEILFFVINFVFFFIL